MDKDKDSIPSNEAIIDELTKDLETSCIRAEENDKSNQGAGLDNTESNLGSKDHDSDSEDKCGAKPPEKDFVDEERLKDREIDLTDEEKENLKAEAEALKNEGNNLFKSSNYNDAMVKYTQALQTCPLAYPEDRAILYANRAAAKAKDDDKESAIKDCSKAIELNPSYLKAYLRRAQLYEQTDNLDQSLADYKKIIELDPGNSEAQHAVRRLPPLIEEKNEKLKEEMLGKLKDLGNMILKPFGLSTNNFQLDKDPSTGGYSVKFNQGNS
ncbi:tetratricopeptide repeat protein 1 [Microplitis demolitor]|uniref:tetratricopeptide repeat protein 1 n=1 Tax=Microplitis demolitor TaxID=69319 RepID=UPI0004CC9D40|nr:tetratricopeptide repeat protein 1 [Microplitis demolitor]